MLSHVLVDLVQELLADSTFRPRINPASRMAESKLKVVSDPGNYIATVEVGPCCSSSSKA